VAPTEVSDHPPTKYAPPFIRLPFWDEFSNAGEGGGGIGMDDKNATRFLPGQYAFDYEYLFEYYR
jgi:hypothetical protein